MSEAREWLIRKDGYFYRPNKSGYTTSKFEAGRYTKDDAEREAAIEPWHMSAIHQSEWPDDPASRTVSDKDAEIEQLRRELTADDKYHAGYLAGSAVAEASRKLRLEAEAKVAEMQEALEPFAKLDHTAHGKQRYFLQLLVCPEGDTHPEDWGDNIRRARRALSDAKEQAG